VARVGGIAQLGRATGSSGQTQKFDDTAAWMIRHWSCRNL